jgi:hypothetical protein
LPGVTTRPHPENFSESLADTQTESAPPADGALGAALTDRLIERRWFERGAVRRALVVTEKGWEGLTAISLGKGLTCYTPVTN